jgi:adenine-specific DNA-methyltransferase
MENLLEHLKNLLKKDERLVSKDELLKNKIIELALKLDKDLIKLLLSDKKMKEMFFIDVDGTLIFDKDKFIKFVSNKQFLPDSYTAFKNKIGLIDEKGEFISEKKEVVLSWPYKDCVLEGGMTKEDQKRDEIFWNEILAPDQITRLLDPKVFTNAKRIDKDGEHKFNGFRTDANGDIKDNLIIKGNNLLVLHSLKKRFAGKVKLIYIDPPYYFRDTKEGDTFLYNTNFKLSTWLTFMKDRLRVARDLLRKDGAIFISISDEGLGELKLLMDEIFGRENFMNIISVKTGESLRAIGGGESTRLIKKAEFLVFYAKDRNSFSPNPVYEFVPLKEIIEEKKKQGKKFEYNQILVSEGIKKPFDKFVDGYGNEITIFKHSGYIIKSLDDFIKENKLKDEMEAYEKYADKIFRLALSESSILKRVQEKVDQEFYSIEYIPRSGRQKGRLTRRFFYKQNEVIFLSLIIEIINGSLFRREKLSNLWLDIPWQGIMNEGGVSLKYGKKAEKLIQKIIELSTNEGDIVLDFFAGTGTTCAVAHKMGRQYIGVEQLDYGENSAVVRLKNVINGDPTGISKEVGWQGGGDFVYLELMKWNENFVEKILSAKTKDELKKLWATMKEKAFLSYKVDVKTIDEHAKDFDDLSIEDQKKFLLECLDKNHLYVNYSEIDDEEYGVSEEDKKLNKEFYGS